MPLACHATFTGTHTFSLYSPSLSLSLSWPGNIVQYYLRSGAGTDFVKENYLNKVEEENLTYWFVSSSNSGYSDILSFHRWTIERWEAIIRLEQSIKKTPIEIFKTAVSVSTHVIIYERLLIYVEERFCHFLSLCYVIITSSPFSRA